MINGLKNVISYTVGCQAHRSSTQDVKISVHSESHVNLYLRTINKCICDAVLLGFGAMQSCR